MGNGRFMFDDEKLNTGEIFTDDEWFDCSDLETSDGETEEDIDDELLMEADDDYYDTNSMKMYLAQIGRIPLLTAEEEFELGRIIAEGGPNAKEAEDRLIVSNLRLVVHYAKQFKRDGVALEDLNTMGIEGLLKAVKKYDYSLGFRFSTYASNWIRQSILRHLSEETDPVRIPVYMSENLTKVKRAQKELEAKLFREPTVEEISKATGLSEKMVLKTFEAMWNVVSLDVRVGEDGETTHLDTIADENCKDMCSETICNEFKELINEVLGQLNVREAMVLKLRFGIDADREMTLDEIASLPSFNVSRERVRQLEARALMKIRHNPRLMKSLMDYRTA